MKKLYSFLVGILAIILILWGISYRIESKANSKGSDKLVVYNWGDYIDPELLTEFTKETGVQVQYETFDSNEAMYTKIKQGGTTYDIAIPSEYMIAKMMKENLVEKLDHSQIKGLENIGSDFWISHLIQETSIPFLISGERWALFTILKWSSTRLSTGTISGSQNTETPS